MTETGAADVTTECVRVRHLNHHFGDGETRTSVLSDVSFDLLAGQIVVITGKSGSGKTTLLTLLAALRRVQEGSVVVLGRELRDLSDRELVAVRRGIGFIFQAHNLFASLTAFQNVRMGIQLEDLSIQETERRITTLLTSLGLGERMHYLPAKLSGGQRQRVAIARALVHHPRLILADEPTAALDEEASQIVIDRLKETARRDQTAVIIVTHDTQIIEAADHRIRMSYGRIS